VGIGDRDDSVAVPHRASHPLPYLDDLTVGLKNTFADAGEDFATPVRQSCDQLVDTFRWIHFNPCASKFARVSCDHGRAVASVSMNGRAVQSWRSLLAIGATMWCEPGPLNRAWP